MDPDGPLDGERPPGPWKTVAVYHSAHSHGGELTK